MSWTKDLVRMLCRPGDIATGYCTDTCSTKKECMRLDEYRKDRGFDAGSEFLTAAEENSVLASGSQILIP